MAGTLNRDLNLAKIAKATANDLKVIWRSSITVDSTVQTLATDLAAIAAAGKGYPTAASFSVASDATTTPAARYTQEGTDPDPLTGKTMYDRDDIIITEYYNLQRFKIVEADSGLTTIIEVTYYK